MCECRNCDQGFIPTGVFCVTHDMAIDAGYPGMEGIIYETGYTECECCEGNWQDCPRCGVLEPEVKE
jgi:hypothetical protein